MSNVAPSPLSLGLTGYPLGHSLSPRLHAAALAATGFAGNYELFPVSPEEPHALADLLKRLRAGELHGLNVTIPHKQAVIPLLDDLTSAARAIGAVNTIYFRDGQLIGENTDAPGFLADLQQLVGTRLPEPTRHALVLGAGGSARAVVYALLNHGWQVTIAARHLEQAQVLCAGFQSSSFGPRVSNIEYTGSSIFPLLPGLALLVNTTPLGMSPNTGSSPWPVDLAFPRADVYDLVYNPRETLFVRQAREAGLRARTGLGMLVEQAALAFECWTGRSPSREKMFASAG